MKKYYCPVCGYESDEPIDTCPICKAKMKERESADLTWAAEHVVGIAKDVDDDIKEDLRANFNGECSEVGMYLAMSRVAFREGYPEACIGKRLRLKKPNTPPSLPSFWAKC